MSIKRLPANTRPKAAEFTITHRFVWVDPDVTMEDIMRPSFWAHHCDILSLGDKIDVLARDFSLDAELRVVGKEVGIVKMRMLRGWAGEKQVEAPVEDDSEMPALPTNYKVAFAPKAAPGGGWVARTIDPPMTVATRSAKRAAYDAAIEHARKAEGVAA